MKPQAMSLLALALTTSGVFAADFTDTAQVISATPIIERVTETRQDCSEAPPPPPQEHSVAGPIIGGIAGAILGNQIGQGSGRTAATAAGAIGGAVVGDRVGNPQGGGRGRQAQAPHCRTIESSQDVVKGYRVVYRYNGRDVATTLPYNPGPMVQVGVGVVQGSAPAAQVAPPPSAYPVPAGNVPPPGSGPMAAPPPPPGGSGYTYRY